MSDSWRETIAAIHAESRPTVLVVTGGGASAISQLLAVPGASRTVLEAHVPYAAESLHEWLGRKPDQYCDESTALAMASVAQCRARHLLEVSDTAVQAATGVSCTASLASDRPKRGDHRCFIAIQTSNQTTSYSLTLEKGSRSRADEEILVGQLIVRALASVCGIEQLPEPSLRSTEFVQQQVQFAAPLLAAVWNGASQCVWSLPDGSFAAESPTPPRGLLCGAFNPLHPGHEELRTVAERRLGGAVYYEMSVTNVDKPPLDFLTIERRRQQFSQFPLALTNAPQFWKKAAIFPGTTFVVGSDTAKRIVDVKYYGGDEPALQGALGKIRDSRCKFLVAARLIDGRVLKLSDVEIPDSIRDLFEEIPESDFRVDVSSTELRRT